MGENRLAQMGQRLVVVKAKTAISHNTKGFRAGRFIYIERSGSAVYPQDYRTRIRGGGIRPVISEVSFVSEVNTLSSFELGKTSCLMMQTASFVFAES